MVTQGVKIRIVRKRRKYFAFYKIIRTFAPWYEKDYLLNHYGMGDFNRSAACTTACRHAEDDGRTERTNRYLVEQRQAVYH